MLIVAGVLLLLGWVLGWPESTEEDPAVRGLRVRVARGATARRMAGVGPR